LPVTLNLLNSAFQLGFGKTDLLVCLRIFFAMKKIFFILLFATSFGLISCGGEEDCRTCSLNFAAIENSTEICPDGDGIKVTNTTAGLSILDCYLLLVLE